jgi:hypothetical protein
MDDAAYLALILPDGVKPAGAAKDGVLPACSSGEIEVFAAE